MLTESLVLGCLSGLAGLLVAFAGTRSILALAFPDSPHSVIQATPSWPDLGFASLLSLTTGVVFGIVPAWITAQGEPAEALRGANRSSRERASLSQRSLIIFQAALSLVLLVTAGLLTKSAGVDTVGRAGFASGRWSWAMRQIGCSKNRAPRRAIRKLVKRGLHMCVFGKPNGLLTSQVDPCRPALCARVPWRSVLRNAGSRPRLRERSGAR